MLHHICHHVPIAPQTRHIQDKTQTTIFVFLKTSLPFTITVRMSFLHQMYMHRIALVQETYLIKKAHCRKSDCSKTLIEAEHNTKAIKSILKELSVSETIKQHEIEENANLKNEQRKLHNEVEDLKECIRKAEVMSINKIKHSDDLMNLHIGLHTYNIFCMCLKSLQKICTKYAILEWQIKVFFPQILSKTWQDLGPPVKCQCKTSFCWHSWR